MAVTGYKLRVNGDAYTNEIFDVGNVLTYDLTGLDPDTEYSVEVEAVNDIGNESGYSAPQSATADPAPFAGITLLSNTICSPAGHQGGTSSSIDTTGATLIVIAVSAYNTGHGPIVAGDISDSKSNTWTALTNYDVPDGNHFSRLFYCANPTVDAAHTFTVSSGGADSYLAFAVAAFDNVAASPFDQENGGGSNSATTFQPGSVTPTQDNELVVTSLYYTGSGAATIDSGFSVTDSGSDLFNSGVGLAYKVQTTAAAVNPTWTAPGSAGYVSSGIATFKHT